MESALLVVSCYLNSMSVNGGLMDNKVLQEMKILLTTDIDRDLIPLYMYLHKIEGGYVCMGKVKGDLRKIKDLEKKIRNTLSLHGAPRVMEGMKVPPITTVILRNESVNDQAVQLGLVKAKFNNEDCIMNGGKWLGKSKLRSVGR